MIKLLGKPEVIGPFHTTDYLEMITRADLGNDARTIETIFRIDNGVIDRHGIGKAIYELRRHATRFVELCRDELPGSDCEEIDAAMKAAIESFARAQEQATNAV